MNTAMPQSNQVPSKTESKPEKTGEGKVSLRTLIMYSFKT